MNKTGVLRIIDVNFNRCKEGLRVIEDIFRFILDENILREKIRKLRHSLTNITKGKIFKDIVLCRNAEEDSGKYTDYLEIKRDSVDNILYSNFQRVKESLRVLEEFFKLVASVNVSKIKKIRYEIYTLEKETFKLRSSLRDTGQKRNRQK